jgi:hypothetical protein
MNKDFDSQLGSLIDAHREKRERTMQKVSDAQAAAEEFYRAWDDHRARVVEPTLNGIVAVLAKKGVAAEVGATSQSGTALYVSTADARLTQGYRLNEQPCLSFKPLSWQRVQIEYPRFHKEELELSKVTQELIQARALAFIDGLFGSS